MARIDIPQLQCDRCKADTTDTREMTRYQKLTHYHMSGSENWDICPRCWKVFRLFIENSGRLTFVVDDLPEFDPKE